MIVKLITNFYRHYNKATIRKMIHEELEKILAEKWEIKVKK